jgi:hypothetical protein
MVGPSDLELGGVNNHSINKIMHVTQRCIQSQQTSDNTEKNPIWFPTQLGISAQGLATDAQVVNKSQLKLLISNFITNHALRRY